MAKGAAKESKLAALHDLVATVLIEQISERVEEEREDGTTIELYTATPATLTVALKLLKDNEITCVPEEDNKMATLSDKLAQRKRGHGKVIEISPKGDEHAIG